MSFTIISPGQSVRVEQPNPPAHFTNTPGNPPVRVEPQFPRFEIPLGPGIIVSGGSGADFERETTDTLAAGQAVCVMASGVRLAGADTNSFPAVGLSVLATAAGFSATVRTGGMLTFGDWSQVVGAAGLTSGAEYFLSPTTPGRLTTTPPTAVGQVVQRIGRAVNSTTLAVEIAEPILL